MPVHFCGNPWHDVPMYVVYAVVIVFPATVPVFRWLLSKTHRTSTKS